MQTTGPNDHELRRQVSCHKMENSKQACDLVNDIFFWIFSRASCKIGSFLLTAARFIMKQHYGMVRKSLIIKEHLTNQSSTQTNTQANKRTINQTNNQTRTHEPTNEQTNKQTNKRTNKQTHKRTNITNKLKTNKLKTINQTQTNNKQSTTGPISPRTSPTSLVARLKR